ncbi:hypothetical protein U717_17930 [Rhodobacter capsulatus R121]|jgi:hypothetical protein|nr:hypothetical protein U714_17955 [Rhodobacter capsulatus DE442]ETD74455.1 hypothetical protein U717_17930 [Rhodobacter capsulatus R121]ETD80692.1 hypothetical protein U716_12970 [Rhodobacter capsulatus B6]ETD80976.1 hypothetical protein U703_17505 [Rhodobacter capsulatus YW1]ETD87161.1 hypothetical protein U713_17215 [Rhodobacter capsulatus YW2]ETE52289.1 hypothetical protein U715_17920 [Rhodobacter capsulatus Y262]
MDGPRAGALIRDFGAKAGNLPVFDVFEVYL